MIKEKAIKWAEALESGKYSQAKGRLKSSDNCYCCLGVLCEIEGLEFKHHGGPCYYLASSGSDMVLPENLADALEIKSTIGKFETTGVQVDPKKMPVIAERLEYKKMTMENRDSLVDLNDSGIPFPEIAAFIRLNYERL